MISEGQKRCGKEFTQEFVGMPTRVILGRGRGDEQFIELPSLGHVAASAEDLRGGKAHVQ
jgi:hypothetical protein